MPTARRPQHPQQFEAYALLFGSAASAFGIFLFATGRTKEAYAFGAAGALLGGVIGAVRILGRSPQPRQLEP